MPLRKLTEIELAEARLVFGDGLDYRRVSVWENNPFPDWIAYIGRSPRPNAVTLGSISYFPVTLQTSAEVLARQELKDMCWLMHELTHQWQYQRWGWRYLYDALAVQLRQGMQGYSYQQKGATREDSLRAAHTAGHRLVDFNMEQQGDLARDFYSALKSGGDAGPWEPFIVEFR